MGSKFVLSVPPIPIDISIYNMVKYLYEDLPKQEGDETGTVVLRCPFQHCNTRLLKLTSAYAPVTLRSESSSSTIHMINLKQLDQDPTDISHASSYYQVKDVWDFDNIGVSRPSPQLQQELLHVNDSKQDQFKVERILICSECDKGPLGLAGFNENEANKDVKNLVYYLSCNSVLHDVSDM